VSADSRFAASRFLADAVVVDHICLAFRERAEDSFHVTDEETAGWEDLNRALAERFGIEKCRWHGDVAVPAFAENWTVLWRRDVTSGREI
jgi:hypothetical protein